MGEVIIRYYRVKKGNGYWEPTAEMKAAGLLPVPCGKDGPAAWKRAEEQNAKWKAICDGKTTNSAIPDKGTLAASIETYRKTAEWSKKAPRTREEWERAWKLIEPVFGDVRADTITMPMVSEFRAAIVESVSQREAHRVIKIWRALWKVGISTKDITEPDPSKGVTNTSPQPRQMLWQEGEVVRVVKQAWRSGYHGLAVAVAIGWDTMFSPVDIRGLTLADLTADGFSSERAKTGRAAAGTLSRRTRRLLDTYLEGKHFTPKAQILRNRSGRAYSSDTMGDDFRDIRLALFGSDDRRAMIDLRRSGAVEAIRGGADAEGLSAKMANNLSASNAIHKTYVPVDLATVRGVDAARRKGRRS